MTNMKIMAAGKIQLTEEKETLFIPLYGKAMDFRSKHSVLNDHTASDIVERIGIDLSKHKRPGGRISAVRAKQYDAWAKDFFAKNANAVAIHLGCGLDARAIRIEPPVSVMWFDVDFPEVIDLRRKFFPETVGYRMIASSITTEDWLEAIPFDRPALIIAEGVFEYLSRAEVTTLLDRLTDHFSHGQIAFDIMNSASSGSRKEKLKETTGATIRWTVDDIGEADKLNPRLTRVETVPLFKSAFMGELPLGFRVIFGLVALLPKLRNGMRLLRYEF